MVTDENTGFKIWAVDNVVYGPVELPLLVSWVREERVTRDTWVFAEAADIWRKACQVPELQMFFKSGASAVTGMPATETQFMKAAGLKPGTLRRVKIFAGMDDAQLERFIQYMEVARSKQFADVVRQGEPGDAMYLVLEGEVRVRLMIGSKESILTVLGPGEFFGEIALFDHGPRSADVVTNMETTMLKISASAFQKLSAEAPELASPFLLAMGRTLTQRIRADNKRYRDSISFARAGAGA